MKEETWLTVEGLVLVVLAVAIAGVATAIAQYLGVGVAVALVPFVHGALRASRQYGSSSNRRPPGSDADR